MFCILWTSKYCYQFNYYLLISYTCFSYDADLYYFHRIGIYYYSIIRLLLHQALAACSSSDFPMGTILKGMFIS